MLKHVSLLAAGLALSVAAWAGPKVEMQTTLGRIVIELNQDKAPISTQNFLAYTKDNFYTDTVFHRVIPGFMIQGGGFNKEMEQKATKTPIANEAKNGLKNARGTIAMARTNDPQSATAQFFINHKDNTPLDFPSRDGWGYAVFGKVVEGMDVVDKIAAVPTGPFNRFFPTDVPIDPVVIKSVKVISEK
ncbi:MAG: peptidyl-prolyl cis-trans isomerase [Betaproteobacteria bacterium]|nr:peptidyl-prolyl cis-trans isomerase [Betaproteobacteria bacterium]